MMYLIAIYGWQIAEVAVAEIIARTLGLLVFDARQKIAAGGPTVLARFADQHAAQSLAETLGRQGVPAMIIDPTAVRSKPKPSVDRCLFEQSSLRLELSGGGLCRVDYDEIEMLLVAMIGSGRTQSREQVTERKFSLGKTLLAGGVPMTRKVTREETKTIEMSDETLWLYPRQQPVIIFTRSEMSYDGFGEAMKLSRGLNFAHLKSELQRNAPQAIYDERMLKRSVMTRILGPTLSPESDQDLAFEILSRSLKGSHCPGADDR